jgi:hypothetical protein
MRYSSDKDVDRLIRRLVRDGWHFREGAKHGRLSPPEGGPSMVVAKSPSDWRSIYNVRRDLRRIMRDLDVACGHTEGAPRGRRETQR